MHHSSNCGRFARNVLILLIVLAVPGFLSAQQFRVEGVAGFNLFSLSDPELETKTSGDISGTTTSDLTYDTLFQIGVYGGYNLGVIEIGGEFLFTSGGGETADIAVDGTTIPDSAGSYDYSFYKIGPVLRYYFTSTNPQIVPFAGAALNYVGATVDINDPNLKFTQGYLDIGAFGGANYWLDGFYIGGIARVDYFMTIADDSITGVEVDTGINADFSEITTDGWVPLSIYFTIGTKL